ncbi:MAG: 4Fe-4S dicluster domain-containing protein [Chloroflexota bacterium]
MRFGVMISDVLRSLFKKPATRQYPFEKTAAPDRLRGKLVWDPSRCTGCMLCCKDCPSNALELTTIDRAAKRFVMRYHVDRCTFCAQCVEACKPKCMDMSDEQWELAALKKEEFEVYFGSEEDVKQFIIHMNAPEQPQSLGGA